MLGGPSAVDRVDVDPARMDPHDDAGLSLGALERVDVPCTGAMWTGG
jgi:hypothetical protein